MYIILKEFYTTPSDSRKISIINKIYVKPTIVRYFFQFIHNLKSRIKLRVALKTHSLYLFFLNTILLSFSLYFLHPLLPRQARKMKITARAFMEHKSSFSFVKFDLPRQQRMIRFSVFVAPSCQFWNCPLTCVGAVVRPPCLFGAVEVDSHQQCTERRSIENILTRVFFFKCL